VPQKTIDKLKSDRTNTNLIGLESDVNLTEQKILNRNPNFDFSNNPAGATMNQGRKQEQKSYPYQIDDPSRSPSDKSSKISLLLGRIEPTNTFLVSGLRFPAINFNDSSFRRLFFDEIDP
jgi:hypothetical protein